jgi:hypothetical protein
VKTERSSPVMNGPQVSHQRADGTRADHTAAGHPGVTTSPRYGLPDSFGTG